jgi:thiol-disulfide isomerase/thioredoxin
MGHAFRFIDALTRRDGMDAAHAEVLLSDTTPDVPVRTSDLFLQRVLGEAARREDKTVDALVDSLLTEAWQDRARWEPQIRQLDVLGEVYGTFSPRRLSELEARTEALERLSKELATYEERWELALHDLCRENLSRFLAEHVTWSERLTDETLKATSAEQRHAWRVELLPLLRRFSEADPGVWARLERLRGLRTEAQTAMFRVEIRLASLLRLRTLLVRVAGQAWLERAADDETGGNPMLASYTAIGECEERAVGRLAAAEGAVPFAVQPLPPFEEDLAVVKRVLPSWLGVNFVPASDKHREQLGVENGAVVVQQVVPGSAASEAGLLPGDVVLGPPGQPFREPRQIREWVMMAPRDEPIEFEMLRDDQRMTVALRLGPYPLELPEMPPPPDAGAPAPKLPPLRTVDAAAGASLDVADTRHMLFFWATWCVPCKSAVPELMAWSESTGVPVVALSDEGEPILREFLGGWNAPFPKLVASDELRRTHISYAVSGTPTFVLVDAAGKIEWRQTGYSTAKRLSLAGWDWSPPASGPAVKGPS